MSRSEFGKLFWDAIRGRGGDPNEGPLSRAIVLLAVPMVLEMAMESVFAVVDIFFVSRLGAEAMATVGLTESLLAIIYTLAMGLSIGVTATVARRTGEKNPDAASETTGQAILLGVGIALVLGATGALFAPDLLGLMGAEGPVVEIGVGYTRILLGGNAVILLQTVAVEEARADLLSEREMMKDAQSSLDLGAALSGLNDLNEFLTRFSGVVDKVGSFDLTDAFGDVTSPPIPDLKFKNLDDLESFDFDQYVESLRKPGPEK